MLIAMLYGSIEKAECSMGGKYSFIHSVERCVQTNTQNERTQTNVHCDRAIARKGDIE